MSEQLQKLDEWELAAFAAWVNVEPDKIPASFQAPTCDATMAPWKRVTDAIRAKIENSWRDISTAPKDRSYFIALIPCENLRRKYKPEICYWEEHMKEPKFIFNGWSSLPQPTLWMPIPQ